VLELGPDEAVRFRDSGEIVRELDVRDAAALRQVQALHEAEGPGIVRDPADWPRLLALPKMRTLVARRGARITGYLVDSRTTNKPGILEAGGSSWAVETLVGQALRDREQGARVPVALMRTANVLRAVLVDRLGLDWTPGPGGHTMVRISDPRAFWRAIGGRGAPPPVDRRELASAVFGPHPERWVHRPESMVNDFPIPLPIPPLDHS